MQANFILSSLLPRFAEMLDCPSTVKTYCDGLRAFFNWLEMRNGRRAMFTDWTRQNIIAYRDSELSRFSERTGKRISPSTVALALCAIKRFDSALVKYFGCKPAFLDIQIPQAAATKKIGLNYEEYSWLCDHLRMMARCSKFSAIRCRDAFAAAFYVETGLRRGELAKITFGQLDLDAGALRAVKISKRHPEQDKFLTPFLSEILAAWLPVREAKLIEMFRAAGLDWNSLSVNEKARFPLILAFSNLGDVRRPESLAPQGRALYEIIARIGKRLGIHIYPHKCRHTFARQMLDSGADIRDVAGELGHKNVNTTMSYTTPTEESRKRVLSKRDTHLMARAANMDQPMQLAA